MASVRYTFCRGNNGRARGWLDMKGAFRRRSDGDGEKPPGLGQHYGSMLKSWIICTMCFSGWKDVV